MAVSTEDFVRQIHHADGQLVLSVTGGGSRAIGELLSVPGGSKTVLEAIVPYSAAAMSGFLGAAPERFCSARTARQMAMAAWERGRDLSPSPLTGEGRGEGVGVIGVGCTASLVSDRPKRGPHRIHVAVQTEQATTTHSLELFKDTRDRVEEEGIAAWMVLNTIGEAFGVADRLVLSLRDKERVETIRTEAPTPWRELVLGQLSRLAPPSGTGQGKGTVVATPGAIFPGAFDPLHAGHLQMAEIAARRLGTPVHFEISIKNVDKLMLDYTEMERRAAQFADRQLPLWFTRAPTFAEKAELFPGAAFLVGVDTMDRIGQDRYYGDDPEAAEDAFDQIARNGCRFLVFGRAMRGQFHSLEHLHLPDALRKLCDEVPAEEFREDVSSTQLRAQATDE